ncbi:MAG: AAA family ATPase [Candidatus Omnitrophota bacterium]
MDEDMFQRKHKHSLQDFWVEQNVNPPLDHPTSRFPFVTISRQAGAGAYTLALAVLEEMKQRGGPLFQGWHIFNHELCERIVEDAQLRVSLGNLITEKYRSEIEDMVCQLVSGESPQMRVVKKIFHCIKTVAAVGKAIIIGRGGVCLTRGLERGVHLRLVAPEAVRIENRMKYLGISADEAKKRIRQEDHDRAKLIKTFFQRDPADPLLYDMVWNTGTVPAEAIAKAVVDRIEFVRARTKGLPA